VPIVVLTVDHWVSPAPLLLVEIAVPEDKPDSNEFVFVATAATRLEGQTPGWPGNVTARL
jgi:hypothetical protein